MYVPAVLATVVLAVAVVVVNVFAHVGCVVTGVVNPPSAIAFPRFIASRIFCCEVRIDST